MSQIEPNSINRRGFFGCLAASVLVFFGFEQKEDSNLRLICRYNDKTEKYEKCRMRDLKKGDWFSAEDPRDETSTLAGTHLPKYAVYQAQSDPYVTINSRNKRTWSIHAVDIANFAS